MNFLADHHNTRFFTITSFGPGDVCLQMRHLSSCQTIRLAVMSLMIIFNVLGGVLLDCKTKCCVVRHFEGNIRPVGCVNITSQVACGHENTAAKLHAAWFASVAVRTSQMNPGCADWLHRQWVPAAWERALG